MKHILELTDNEYMALGFCIDHGAKAAKTLMERESFGSKEMGLIIWNDIKPLIEKTRDTIQLIWHNKKLKDESYVDYIQRTGRSES